jgi:hypothetical protein
VGLALLGPLNWGAAVVPLASFTLALATLALVRLISHCCATNNRTDTRMDAPMDVDNLDSHSELPFPGEVVDGEQTIQYFNM